MPALTEGICIEAACTPATPVLVGFLLAVVVAATGWSIFQTLRSRSRRERREFLTQVIAAVIIGAALLAALG